jgi:GntR family transcriptional regulator, transcriptional repressor for pyruvate dehydrogenase complex
MSKPDAPLKESVGSLESDEVFRSLVSLVGSLGDGDRLPSERDLAARLGVHRSTLRDRLQSLESLGVLRRRTGSGTYVQRISPQTVSMVLNLGLIGSGLTMDSLHPLRVALERQAAKEAASRVAAGPMALMAIAVKRMDVTRIPRELYEADIEFHRALFAASESPALIFLADALSGVLARSVEQRLAREKLVADDGELMPDLHRGIYDAVLSGDCQAAMCAVDTHFETIYDVSR